MDSDNTSNTWKCNGGPPNEDLKNKVQAAKKRFLPMEDQVLNKRVATIDTEKLFELRCLLSNAIGNIETASNLAAGGLQLNTESSVLDIALRDQLNALQVASDLQGAEQACSSSGTALPMKQLTFKQRLIARTGGMSSAKESTVAERTQGDGLQHKEQPVPTPSVDHNALNEHLKTVQELLVATNANFQKWAESRTNSLEATPSNLTPGYLQIPRPVVYNHITTSSSISGNHQVQLPQMDQIQLIRSFKTHGTCQATIPQATHLPQSINVYNFYEVKPPAIRKPTSLGRKTTEMITLKLSQLTRQDLESLQNLYRLLSRMCPVPRFMTNPRSAPGRKCEVCSREGVHNSRECPKLSDPDTQAQKYLDKGLCLQCIQQKDECGKHRSCEFCTNISNHFLKYLPVQSPNHHPTLCWVLYLSREANRNLKCWDLLECVRLPTDTWDLARAERSSCKAPKSSRKERNRKH